VNWCNNRFLQLIRQFFLIPNRNIFTSRNPKFFCCFIFYRCLLFDSGTEAFRPIACEPLNRNTILRSQRKLNPTFNSKISQSYLSVDVSICTVIWWRISLTREAIRCYATAGEQHLIACFRVNKYVHSKKGTSGSWVFYWVGQNMIMRPRGSDPGLTVLVKARRNCKRQTRPPVREGAPHQQTRNCSWAPDGT
jgi:hypothetical protein